MNTAPRTTGSDTSLRIDVMSALNIRRAPRLYQAYRNYCLDTNEYVRSTADFYFALENAGYERIVVKRKRFFKGLCLKKDDGDFDDFLT